MKKTNESRFYEEADRPGFESWVTTLRNEDGDILAIEVHTKDESHHFDELSEAEQEKVLAWIQANVKPRETPLEGHTSYGMKHTLQHRTNIYVTNNQFKEAMLLCGFYRKGRRIYPDHAGTGNQRRLYAVHPQQRPAFQSFYDGNGQIAAGGRRKAHGFHGRAIGEKAIQIPALQELRRL